MPTRTALPLLSLLLLTFAADASAQSRATSPRRSGTPPEPRFRDMTGLGFTRFTCAVPDDGPPGREFTCDATDEEGDLFHYRIVAADPEGQPMVWMSQPVVQLNPEGLAVIERPCLAFLDAFAAGRWDEAHRQFSDQFRQRTTAEGLREALTDVRASLGTVVARDARLYATPQPGLHQLQYALETTGGRAVARFLLQFVAEGEARIVAFVVLAEPGTELQARLLSMVGREALESILSRPVADIRGPLDELAILGDAVEGEAVFDDGSAISIRVEQDGSVHDFDRDDYRFQVLDVPTILRLHYEAQGTAIEEARCPRPVTPDGGQLYCTVNLGDGSERTVTVMRRGGQHRLVDSGG
ncbi:MAG: DUF4019 domain-containing protein [Gammaproteobacteria bacterium]|nr:DUF4019 domain-containing protein [Gammaproteobacteria bacterium]